MSKAWPLVHLEKVAVPIERPEVPTAGILYRQIGVKLWGEGAYERETIDGSQTKYRTLSRVETDDIIVNKIWARNGSVAVVPEKLSGCYASTEFPLFTPIREKLYPRWVHWITKTKNFWQQCDEKSQGTSGKNRIRPEKFLAVEIPLPPLSEQQRIVARIETVAAKIEEAFSVRQQAIQEAATLSKNAGKLIFGLPNRTVGEIAEVTKLAGFEYTEYFNNAPPGEVIVIRAGNVRNTGLDISNAMTIDARISDKLPRSQLKPMDVVMTFIGAKIGDVTFIPNNCQRVHCGPNVAKLTPSKEIYALYLVYVLQSQIVQGQIQDITKKTAQPNLSMKTIRQLRLPVPPLNEQRWIVAYLDNLQSRIDKLRRLQAETQKELNALMPSILDKAFKGEL